MSDTCLKQLTDDLSEDLDGYCENCIYHAMGIQLVTTIIRLSDTKEDAEANVNQMADMIRQVIFQNWEYLKAEEESESAMLH